MDNIQPSQQAWTISKCSLTKCRQLHSLMDISNLGAFNSLPSEVQKSILLHCIDKEKLVMGRRKQEIR